jgi:ABC-type transporter Mla MlaB component
MSTIDLTPDGKLTIVGSLNTDSVMGLWPDYQNELAKLSELEINLGSVEHFDTAGLAWLIQLSGECEQQNIPFSLINTPAQIVSLANLSQVKTLLLL